MSLSQMQVFNDYIMPATIVSLAQMIDKFNAGSAGAITLSSEGMTGDFMRESFFASLAAAQRRVDRYAAQASASATDLTELTRSSVKIAGGFGPVRYEPSQMTWLQRPTQQGVAAASTAFAELLLQDQLNVTIAALVAAIENQASLTNDVSASAGMTYGAINSGHALFGDMSGGIVADVMTGTVAHKLIGDNLTNGTRLFQAGNVNIIDILNKAVIVTDAPALYEAGSPNKSKVLGLVSGAAAVSNASDVITNVETTNGQTRIETTFQADYSFGLGIKGYTWDETNGGASPSDAELATGSNWDKVAQFDKLTAGVIAVADADQ
ncbi:major capsid protein [uncultured Ruegeria sp.]|uniref:major capsid protein n=1 Tax=uncultured Ruegeria sp. TaxID=259304 RepID=UPI002623E17A|nr:major capsid protein [uncultured Ruegeria sp.]